MTEVTGPGLLCLSVSLSLSLSGYKHVALRWPKEGFLTHYVHPKWHPIPYSALLMGPWGDP